MKNAFWRAPFGLLLLLFCVSCGPPENATADASKERPAATKPATTSSTATTGSAAEAAAKSSGPFVLGDLIKPFTPPPLAELDAKAQWIDRPVLDSLALLRQRQKDEKPLATVAAALQLRNTSDQENAKILSALGRLPDDDANVRWDAPFYRFTLADMKSSNPILASSTTEFDVGGLISPGLFGFDWKFTPFASKDTVVSWQTSKDQLYDKIVMRNDLTWSDGVPFTAHDVVFSFKAILSSAVPVPAMRSGADKIRWIEAYDDHTLVFFHLDSLATNIWNVNFAIIPKHIYEKSIYDDPTLQNNAYHVRYENAPVTCGPYTLKERTRDKEIVLERREDWYLQKGKQVRDKPYFKEIRFRIIKDPSVALLALKRGDIDELELNAEQWTGQTSGDDFYERNTKVWGVEWSYAYFGWNAQSPFFSDVRVRKAMSYALNHKELLQRRLYGLYQPCVGTFHPDSPWAPKNPPQPYHQDLDEAERLLDEAGWKDSDGDGVRDKLVDGKPLRFEFSLLYPTGSLAGEAACTLMKENLEQIGILCNVRPLEFTVLMEETLNKKFQAYFGGWGTGADPDTSENIWGTGQERNFVSYSNPEVDRLFAAGRKTFDQAEREKIYARIHEILWEDQPYTWLFYRNAFYGFSKQLRGYNFSPRGPYNYGPGISSIWKPAQTAP